MVNGVVIFDGFHFCLGNLSNERLGIVNVLQASQVVVILHLVAAL